MLARDLDYPEQCRPDARPFASKISATWLGKETNGGAWRGQDWQGESVRGCARS